MDSSERENGGSSDEQNNTGDEDKNDLDSGDAEEIKRRRIQQSPSKKGFMVSGNHYEISLLILYVEEVRINLIQGLTFSDRSRFSSSDFNSMRK